MSYITRALIMLLDKKLFYPGLKAIASLGVEEKYRQPWSKVLFDVLQYFIFDDSIFDDKMYHSNYLLTFLTSSPWQWLCDSLQSGRLDASRKVQKSSGKNQVLIV